MMICTRVNSMRLGYPWLNDGWISLYSVFCFSGSLITGNGGKPNMKNIHFFTLPMKTEERPDWVDCTFCLFSVLSLSLCLSLSCEGVWVASETFCTGRPNLVENSFLGGQPSGTSEPPLLAPTELGHRSLPRHPSYWWVMSFRTTKQLCGFILCYFKLAVINIIITILKCH